MIHQYLCVNRSAKRHPKPEAINGRATRSQPRLSSLASLRSSSPAEVEMATTITTTIKTTTTTNGTSCVLWLVPLLLFCGCFKKDPWTVTSVRTGNPEYDSAKLAYSSTDPVNGIDLELV